MVLEYIFFFSEINFLLLAVLLWFKKTPNKKTNNILCVLLLLMSVYSISILYHYTTLIHHSYSSLKYYTPVDGIFLLLMAPCLYFYVRAVLNIPEKIWKWKSILHIIPLLPSVVFNVYFSTYSHQHRIDWLVRDFETGTSETIFLNAVLYVQMMGYLLYCYFLIKKQLKVSPTLVIDHYTVDVSWLRVFLLSIIGYMLLSTPFCIYFANERANIIIGQLAMDILYIYLFFKTMLHADAIEILPVQTVKESAFRIQSEQSNHYLTLIEKHFQVDKPYLEEGYDIKRMSEQTEIPVHHITHTLKKHFKETFIEFTNKHRVEEAKRLLSLHESEGSTLESIGYDCGFESRTTFIRVFKKHTDNITPSKYRLQLKKLRRSSSIPTK